MHGYDIRCLGHARAACRKKNLLQATVQTLAVPATKASSGAAAVAAAAAVATAATGVVVKQQQQLKQQHSAYAACFARPF